jgi:methyltransferase family protein
MPHTIYARKWGRLPAPVIFRMATAYWASQAIYVAAKLGIADVLGDRPKSGDEIASAIGANSKSLARLTRALIALGVLAVVDDGRFQSPELGPRCRAVCPVPCAP